jgi:type I restriction enzyme S subunit
LNTVDVIVVEKKLQNQFAAFVAQVDKSKVAVQKSLEEVQLLFNSLMQEYFG